MVALALLLLAGCKRDRCNVPIGETGAIYLPDYPDIYNNVGGTVVLNKGHRGILVRCSGFGEYMAFECACPQDHDVRKSAQPSLGTDTSVIPTLIGGTPVTCICTDER